MQTPTFGDDFDGDGFDGFDAAAIDKKAPAEEAAGRSVWVFHAPGDDGVRVWRLEHLERKLRVTEDGKLMEYLLKDEEAAVETCRRWREEKVAEGWREVETTEDGAAPAAAEEINEAPAAAFAENAHPRADEIFGVVSRGDVEAMKELLDYGVPADATDAEGTTPLQAAAAAGHLDLVNLLLDAYADVHARASGGLTALMFVARSEDAGETTPEVLRLLLDAGADLEARNDAGQTALTLAVAHAQAMTVSDLLALGADVNARDPNGVSPLMLARYYRRHRGSLSAEIYNEIEGQLLAAGASEDGLASLGLLNAAERGDLDEIDAFLAEGADVNFRIDGSTPILVAADKGHADAVRRLAEAGADTRGLNEEARALLG